MPPEERNALILERLKQVTRYAYDRSAFYRRHWERAGFHPDHLKDLEDFEEKVPVITKGDLRESQARVPGFGDYLCISEDGDPSHPRHLRDHRSANRLRRRQGGLGRHRQRPRPDHVGHGTSAGRHGLYRLPLFSLYWGSWGTLIGSQRLRAKSFPFGAGAPGMTAAGRGVAAADQAHGFLFHTLLCAAPGGGGCEPGGRPG